jgi:hypothetical protein
LKENAIEVPSAQFLQPAHMNANKDKRLINKNSALASSSHLFEADSLGRAHLHQKPNSTPDIIRTYKDCIPSAEKIQSFLQAQFRVITKSIPVTINDTEMRNPIRRQNLNCSEKRSDKSFV